MVATKERTAPIRTPSDPVLAGRLAAPNDVPASPGFGRLAGLADVAVKSRLSDDPEAFIVAAGQQPGE